MQQQLTSISKAIEQPRRQVPFAERAREGDDAFALQVELLDRLGDGADVRAGGDAAEDALFDRQAPGPFVRLVVGVDVVGIEL